MDRKLKSSLWHSEGKPTQCTRRGSAEENYLRVSSWSLITAGELFQGFRQHLGGSLMRGSW